jgi:hypothetical protein
MSERRQAVDAAISRCEFCHGYGADPGSSVNRLQALDRQIWVGRDSVHRLLPSGHCVYLPECQSKQAHHRNGDCDFDRSPHDLLHNPRSRQLSEDDEQTLIGEALKVDMTVVT